MNQRINDDFPLMAGKKLSDKGYMIEGLVGKTSMNLLYDKLLEL